MKPTGYFFLCIFLLTSCSSPKEAALKDNTYLVELEKWRADRLTYLTRADGWTTLVGLYWLKEDVNTYGSGSDNSIVFPEAAPVSIGSFQLKDSFVIANTRPNTNVLLDGIVAIESVQMHTDIEKETNYFTFESLQWHIIKRGDKFGIRLKDTLNQARFDLKELPHFPVDEKWVVNATFEPADSSDILNVLNAVGINSALHPEGTLSFQIDGKAYSFIALDGGEEELFIVMGDETTGNETYGGGRFLDIPRADSTGRTVIDFNKAYNPPCVYSEYATCPLPSKENVLPIAVNAGEIMEDGHEHD